MKTISGEISARRFRLISTNFCFLKYRVHEIYGDCQYHPREDLRQPKSTKDQRAISAEDFKGETRASGERGEIEEDHAGG